MSDSYRRLCDDLPRGSGAPGNFAAEPRKVKAWVAALPMKIARGTGGPLRIVAFVPDGP